LNPTLSAMQSPSFSRFRLASANHRFSGQNATLSLFQSGHQRTCATESPDERCIFSAGIWRCTFAKPVNPLLLQTEGQIVAVPSFPCRSDHRGDSWVVVYIHQESYPVLESFSEVADALLTGKRGHLSLQMLLRNVALSWPGQERAILKTHPFKRDQPVLLWIFHLRRIRCFKGRRSIRCAKLKV
jgi:hypothetical protein